MIKICKCKPCGHEWATKQEKPRICPACRVSGWDGDVVVSMALVTHVCSRCKWEWEGKENPLRCQRCQSLLWRQERKIHSHMCQKCLKEWKSGVEKPLKCPGCQTKMEKTKHEIYIYVNGGRRGTRCFCGTWYPHIEGRQRYRCPGCKSGDGGKFEIEPKEIEIGDEENWGPL